MADIDSAITEEARRDAGMTIENPHMTKTRLKKQMRVKWNNNNVYKYIQVSELLYRGKVES